MSKSTGKKNVSETKATGTGIEYTSSPVLESKLRISRGKENEQSGSKPTRDNKPSPAVGLGLDKSVLKRELEEDDELEYGHEMSHVMQTFGTDMTKALHAKKKRLESFTVGTLKANQKMVVEPWENQLNNSREIANELVKLCASVLDQAESDLQQMKDHDEKLYKVFQQQIKTNASNRAIMQQRVAAFRQINDTFQKKTQEQDAKHRDELTHVQYDLKKELSALQKKMLNDGQKEEMENVKKNLTKMFFMSSN